MGIILAITIGSVLLGGTISYYTTKRIQRYYEKLEQKISDAEVIHLAISGNGMLTVKELAKHSGLTKMQASTRLNSLYSKGAFKQLYDNLGYVSYALKDKYTPIKQISDRKNSRDITDEEIINVARISNFQLTPAKLCYYTNIPMKEAKKRLKLMVKQDIFDRQFSSRFSVIYRLKSEGIQGISTATNKTIELVKKEEVEKIDINQLTVSEELNHDDKKILKDAMVISVAVEQGGNITATSLCFRTGFSIDQAQVKLDELHRKEVFEIKVSENGTIVYQLNDKSLLN